MLGERRFFVTLSATEGFGLPALEAMAMGATVVGFDGFGGRDYMKPGTNCMVRPFPDIEGVADAIRQLSADPRKAESMAEAGRNTAAEQRFTYEAFRTAWQRQFQSVLCVT
jgi:glycosyltransferase involved in cell wall biosynthesis